jgi:hypothetical protein
VVTDSGVKQLSGWHLGQANELGRVDAAMASDDRVVSVHQDRARKTKSSDAIGDLTNLVFGMSTSIPWVWLQRRYWSIRYS